MGDNAPPRPPRERGGSSEVSWLDELRARIEGAIDALLRPPVPVPVPVPVRRRR